MVPHISLSEMSTFEPLSVAGRGRFGICRVCRKENGEKVVVKEISVDDVSDQEMLNEVGVLQMLSHPNIIGYCNYFIENRNLCIVMEYASEVYFARSRPCRAFSSSSLTGTSPGGTLSNMLDQRNGRLMDEERILYYFMQIALALQYIHSKQILHLDLKPDNILFNRAKTVCKLSDFGSSQRLGTKSRDFNRNGSPSYTSPEIFEGRAYNHKTDLWSLGCILYEMSTLKCAFEGPTLFALVMKVAKANFDPISDDLFSAPLKSLVENLLNVNDKRRPELDDILSSPLLQSVTDRVTLEIGTKSLPVKGALAVTPSQLTTVRRRLKTNSYFGKIFKCIKMVLSTSNYDVAH